MHIASDFNDIFDKIFEASKKLSQLNLKYLCQEFHL